MSFLSGLAARFRNVMRQETQMAVSHLAFSRTGTVQNYDPDRHAVRVLIQPEGILTGYIPVKEPWVGNGWGMYAPPSIGDVVDVEFLQGSKDSSGAGLRYYSAKTKPLSVPSGEFWLVHKTGSLLKLHNDGSVEVSAKTNMTLSAPNGIFRVVAQQIQMHATQIYRFDCAGHGQAWTPSLINTYQIGEVPGTAHDINPPEIGN